LKYSREFKIGTIFILAIIILLWGFNFLKGKNVFTRERKFYALYHDVGGLVRANPVLINGLKVGQVDNMYFDPKMNGDIVVELQVKGEFPIPKNSISTIFSSDLLGSKAIQIKLGDSHELAQGGDTLATEIEATLQEQVNQQILPLKRKAENLISSIDTMVVAVQGILNKDSREELRQSIRSIRATFDNLKSTTTNIDTLVMTQTNRLAGILNNLELITRNIRENNSQINAVIDNLATITDTLANSHVPQIADNLNKTLANLALITDKIKSGEGSLGLLLTDDKLYNDLEKAAREISALAEDIRVNPKRYVKFAVF
jgi:phospholipid/cholesterol/gamma-HCH transport system substrate-binding protein